MKIIDWNALDGSGKAQVLARPPSICSTQVKGSVAAIIERVQREGDAALYALTRQFDGALLNSLEVSADEFALAERDVAPDLVDAMKQAIGRLQTWHRAGMQNDFSVDTAPGVRCGRVLRGIGRVGLYIPAGSAPLPSTALMLGVPAQLAQCAQIVACTPCNAEGRADPAVLMAAKLVGIDRVFKIGGAQAIAAMALGTESVPKCDKLFGPGNAYVTAAKQQVSMQSAGPAIDMPAGPSEVLVIADAGANADFVAADLLSQAEHGADSQVILLSDTPELIERVRVALDQQLQSLPRAALCRQALQHARGIRVDSIAQALDISNRYAPEHLILALRDAALWLPQVRAAGSVFLGDLAPEAVGDYCSGTNHVLPTSGAARAYSGVSVASFQTSISVQQLSFDGVRAIGACAVTLARAEGLEAHARAVLLRTEAV